MNWDIYKQLADRWYEDAECFGISKGKIGVAAFIKQGGAE